MALDCFPAAAPRLAVRATTALLALVVSVALLNAQSETVVTVSPGTYGLSQILTQGGTPTNQVRYKPVTPNTVTIRGGGTINRSYVTLEGFLFDNTLNPSYPSNGSHALTVGTNVVGARIENSEIKASVQDVHTGYSYTTNGQSCTEGEGMPSLGVLSVNTGANVTVTDSLLHGGHDVTNHIDQATVRFERTLLRGNFNGLQVGTTGTIEFIESVLWDSPNHPITMDSSGQNTLTIENSLFVIGQLTVRTQGELGGTHFSVKHSTFYMPNNHPCVGQPGVDPTNVRERVLVENNIFVTDSANWSRALTSQLSYYTSDYNLGFQWSPSSNRQEFRLDGKDLSLEQWQTATGKDRHTVRGRPLFADARVFASPLPTQGSAANQWGFRVPSSAAQARAWFTLMTDSPGKRAGSDGLDIGIVTGGVSAPSAPRNLLIIP